MVAAYILSMGGGLLQVFAPNLGAFVGGRAINGIAFGTATATAPLYLSEVWPLELFSLRFSYSNILARWCPPQ